MSFRHRFPTVSSIISIISITSIAVMALGLSSCSDEAGSTDVGQAASRDGELPTVKEVPSIAENVPAQFKQAGTLKVVMSTSSPPAHFTTADGMAGADADLAVLLGNVMGLDVDVTGVPLDQILPGLHADRYSAVVSQFSPTADRAKVLDFVNYAESGTSLGVPSGNPQTLTPENLCGHLVGVQKGSSQAAETVPALSKECQADGKPAVKMSTFPESTAAVLGLQSKRVDAILLDSPVLGYAAKQADGAVKVAGTIDAQPVAIGVVKSSDLETSIQAALKYLDRQGVLAKVFEEWGMNDSVIHDFAINKITEG